MSMNESNGIITLMRGDTFQFPVKINIGTLTSPKYKKLDENDVLYFGLMEPGKSFEDAVLKKRIDQSNDTDSDGYPIITIDHKDTSNLLVGKYYYTIKLRTISEFGNEIVRTIVKPTLFWLDGENPIDEVEHAEEVAKGITRIVFDGGEIV